jgi:hypothetical protein
MLTIPFRPGMEHAVQFPQGLLITDPRFTEIFVAGLSDLSLSSLVLPLGHCGCDPAGIDHIAVLLLVSSGSPVSLGVRVAGGRAVYSATKQIPGGEL